ncbi:acetylornithine deacetylase [Asaia siamensis]
MSELIETLSCLVGFPSLCGTPNGAIMDWIEAQLLASDARIRRIPGDVPGRSSLFATIGPDVPGGIMLSAHADIVPVAGQDWSSDPFTLMRRSDRLYGRGSSDMKGFLACMIDAARRVAQHPVPLSRPLYLAISHDEELGCLGVRSLLRSLCEGPDLGMQGCVVGEPTQMQVALAHKGKTAFTITCLGVAAHSANPGQGLNAITLAGLMIKAVSDLQDSIRAHELQDSRFAVPFSTVQIGLAAGGTALNIVPDHCILSAEMRLLPGYEAAPYIEFLRQAGVEAVTQLGGGKVEIAITNAYPGLDMPQGSTLCADIMHEVGRNDTTTIDFGTEAGLFREALGIDCVVCGPGSIDRAHKADEYITISELEEGARLVDAIVARLR